MTIETRRLDRWLARAYDALLVLIVLFWLALVLWVVWSRPHPLRNFGLIVLGLVLGRGLAYWLLRRSPVSKAHPLS